MNNMTDQRICPRCGAANNADTLHCVYCGAMLAESVDETDKRSRMIAAVIAAVTALMFLSLSIVFVVRSGVFGKGSDDDVDPTYNPLITHTMRPTATQMPSQAPAWNISTPMPTPAPTAVPAATPVPVPPATAPPVNGYETQAPAAPVSGSSDDFNETSDAYIMRHPNYSTYMDNMYNFTCKYPSHFIDISDNSTGAFVVQSPDGMAVQHISVDFADGHSPQELIDLFAEALDGTIENSYIRSDEFLTLITDNEVDYQVFGKLKDENVYYVMFGYVKSYKDIYENYISVIEDSFTVY